jgi:hypothetical protein
MWTSWSMITQNLVHVHSERMGLGIRVELSDLVFVKLNNWINHRPVVTYEVSGQNYIRHAL